jgi:arylsulfatase B
MLTLLLGCSPGAVYSPILPAPSEPAPPPAITTKDTATVDSGVADTGGEDTAAAPILPDTRPNVLLIISDDLGIEASACYEGVTDTSRAPQPTIAGLCDRGMVFESAWSFPMCSPTRAAILTGRNAWRNGVGWAINDDMEPLSMDEVTLPEAIDASTSGYSHANIGKWHLGDDGSLDYPNRMGWGHFSGLLKGTPTDYLGGWSKVVDGETIVGTEYLTTDTVNDAIDWIDEQSSPWVLWLALNAPHIPFHAPPEDLHDYELSGDPESDPLSHYQAMIQAMDTELGRLLNSMDPDTLARTYIIYVGDNGTISTVNQGLYPTDHSKGSLYQGGVHVPLIISGPGIVGGTRADGLVQITDLHPTILEMIGGEAAEEVELDGVSLMPMLTDPEAIVHTTINVEYFDAEMSPSKSGKAARTSRYKLVMRENKPDELFDLLLDPLEENILRGTLSAEESIARETLSAVLAEVPEL